MKQKYDAKHGHNRDVEVGRLVRVRRIQVSDSSFKKFANSFIGPFRVVGGLSNTTYLVEDIPTNQS